MSRREPMVTKAVRVPEALWRDAMNAAETQGDVLSEVIRKELTRYVRQSERAKSKAQT